MFCHIQVDRTIEKSKAQKNIEDYQQFSQKSPKIATKDILAKLGVSSTKTQRPKLLPKKKVGRSKESSGSPSIKMALERCAVRANHNTSCTIESNTVQIQKHFIGIGKDAPKKLTKFGKRKMTSSLGITLANEEPLMKTLTYKSLKTKM